jgi:hypothetical protein
MRQNHLTIIRVGVIIALVITLAFVGCTTKKAEQEAQTEAVPESTDDWVQDFNLADRALLTEGENQYFILKPGYQLVLEGDDEKVVMTVLGETQQIGEVTTRVVEEREEEDGELEEISRNFLAICAETGDVFYFGEEVELYEDGEKVEDSGEWRADAESCKAGMLMPGDPVVGAKYYQEFAPGKAMDRAEIVSLSDTLTTPSGTFENCLKILETSALDTTEAEYKIYAPGIGLIQDEDLLLVRYGYVEGE